MHQPRPPYEVFEHTADIGLQAYATTLPGLFTNAALGMQSLMVPLEQINQIAERTITVSGHDHLSLLIGWLNELVFLFDTAFLLVSRIEIEQLSERELQARVFGEQYDQTRHMMSSAIKAVTWHEAAIKTTDDGYMARIIFDI